jgi:hypothetical protein
MHIDVICAPLEVDLVIRAVRRLAVMHVNPCCNKISRKNIFYRRIEKFAFCFSIALGKIENNSK